MVCGVLNISVARDLATSPDTRVSLDRKVTAEFPCGFRSVGSSPGSEHLPMLQQCEALSLVVQLPLQSCFSAHAIKKDRKYIHDYQSGLQSPFSTHTFQDAVNCPAALCTPPYLTVQLKILSKGRHA